MELKGCRYPVVLVQLDLDGIHYMELKALWAAAPAA